MYGPTTVLCVSQGQPSVTHDPQRTFLAAIMTPARLLVKFPSTSTLLKVLLEHESSNCAEQFQAKSLLFEEQSEAILFKQIKMLPVQQKATQCVKSHGQLNCSTLTISTL